MINSLYSLQIDFACSYFDGQMESKMFLTTAKKGANLAVSVAKKMFESVALVRICELILIDKFEVAFGI